MPIPRDPDARRYYRAGKQRLSEAELILRQVKLPAAAVYLAGYAVECLLKSLLIERTPEVERAELVGLMKTQYGHNFTRLRAALAYRGVHVPANVVGEMTFVSRWSPELRYDPGPGSATVGNRFVAASARIVHWADRGI